MSDATLEPLRKKARRNPPFQLFQSVVATFFPDMALKWAIHDFFLESRAVVADETAMYQIQDGFGGNAPPYWLEHTRLERFKSTKNTGLLYRPLIVNQLIHRMDMALSNGSGVIVKGSHGTGKSHSLVNLVRKLHSTNNYLVTFIPDCDQFQDLSDLCNAICQSFGSTMENLKLDMGINVTMQQIKLKTFIKTVDRLLNEQGKKWVFVFDQVNRLFSRLQRKDVGLFEFPFYILTDVILRNRITCIISASANNETTFSDNRKWFVPWDHPLKMEKSELRLLFPKLQLKEYADQKRIFKLTGRVPLQVSLRLQLESNNNDNHGTLSPQELDKQYTEMQVKRIMESLDWLRTENRDNPDHWKCIRDAAISCVFQQYPDEIFGYDRKYSVWNERRGLLEPLFPAVLDAYQAFFQKEVMSYMKRYGVDLPSN